MKSIQLILFLVAISIITSCNKKIDKEVTNPEDYNTYLEVKQNTSLNALLADAVFWRNKIKNTPNQYPYNMKLASVNSSIFKLTGDIDELKKAEENLLIANKRTNYNNANHLRVLAQNYISQHRFNEALDLALKAEKNGEKLEATKFILIDIYLELGNLSKVEEYLSKIKEPNSFNSLIRLSKYSDHRGDLDSAINYLERSLKVAQKTKNKTLLQWNYTNLADYYGHAGRIEDSYNAYLKALELNPSDSYAKKGIAWVVYSHEKNAEEALRILSNVMEENQSPDYNLLKAEIAEFLGKEEVKEAEIEKYLSKIENEKYGGMYNKYSILLFSDDASTIEKAGEIAKIEVKERQTAQSYDLLAWTEYKKGNKEKALEILENHVIDKTFEPEALLHVAQILKANGKIKEANSFKKELLESSYELGPASEEEIKNI